MKMTDKSTLKRIEDLEKQVHYLRSKLIEAGEWQIKSVKLMELLQTQITDNLNDSAQIIYKLLAVSSVAVEKLNISDKEIIAFLSQLADSMPKSSAAYRQVASVLESAGSSHLQPNANTEKDKRKLPGWFQGLFQDGSFVPSTSDDDKGQDP